MSLFTLVEQGGPILIPLGICSVLVIAVILERMWSYGRIGHAPKELLHRLESLLARGDWQASAQLIEDYDSPYARIIKATLIRHDASADEITDMLTLACDAEIASATRPLPVLGTIGNIAPFIGLLGTVIGIINAFHSISSHSSTGYDVVSRDISQALIATAIGIGVGIVAVVANNWCNAWVERYRLDLECFSTAWAYRLEHLRSSAVTLEPMA